MAHHPGVEELQTTVPGLTPLGRVAPTDEFIGSEDQPQADPTYPLAPLPMRWRFD